MTKQKCLRILFLDILTDDTNARKRIQRDIYLGKTYANHVKSFLGLANIEILSVDGTHRKLPNPKYFDAMIIGGSRHNPVDGEEKPWILRVYAFIRMAAKNNIPILGICGGLQFTVRALGGEIIYNPKGREFGSIEISLTKDGRTDPIFRGLPQKITVQETHRCMAKDLKLNWTLLASSKLCKIQTLAIGSNIRLFQFHPEMTAMELKKIADSRKYSLIEEGLVKNEKEYHLFRKSIQNTNKVGKRILKNFITYFVLPYHNNVH